MFEPTTHFEQVSLEIVRKILEDQIRRETTTEQDQGTTQRTLEDLFGAQEQPKVRSRVFSHAEV
jgi:hypothetical protein